MMKEEGGQSSQEEGVGKFYITVLNTENVRQEK
jgi:hypothetical protein